MRKISVIRRFIPVFMAAVCLFIFFAFAFGSGIGADHECAEGFCHVCFGISLCGQLTKCLAVAASVFSVFAALGAFADVFTHVCRACDLARTPVCLKVKLSN